MTKKLKYLIDDNRPLGMNKKNWFKLLTAKHEAGEIDADEKEIFEGWPAHKKKNVGKYERSGIGRGCIGLGNGPRYV